MSQLDERNKKILCAIIQCHIDFNMPIGSFFITQQYQIGLSPATIRNTMTKLENMGYITQPHTSSGRIPTEKGYRFYVDTLLHEETFPLNTELSRELSARFINSEKNSGKIIREAAKTLSLFSHCLAIAIPPKTEEVVLKRIKFIKYEKKKLLSVLISENGTVFNKIIELDTIFHQKQLDKASYYLNNRFSGITIKEVKETLAEQLFNDKVICDQLINNFIMLCKEVITSEADDFSFNTFAGTSRLPDFATMKQIKDILEAIEDRQFVLRLLNQISDSRGIRVFVGIDNIMPALKELSLVVSTYRNRRDASGAIGIIGPTRMNYKNLIPMVEDTAKTLTRTLSAE